LIPGFGIGGRPLINSRPALRLRVVFPPHAGRVRRS
jgi:hypothetical protein